MINTGSFRLASGRYWLTINTNANASVEIDDISSLQYDFDLTDSEDIISKIAIIPGVATITLNDTMDNLASLYDTLQAQIGAPSPTLGYTTISATLYRFPYDTNTLATLEQAIQEFPFQVQFNGVQLNELSGETTMRLLPPQAVSLNVAQFMTNVTGNKPTQNFALALGGIHESTVYAPGDVMRSLTANLNKTALTTVFESSPIGGGPFPPVTYPDYANVGIVGNVSFFVTEFASGSASTGQIYDNYKSMAGLDSAVYGSAFGTNFYVGRLTTNHKVVLTFDDVVSVNMIKVNRDINLQTFAITNPAPSLSQIAPDTDSAGFNGLSTRNVGISYSSHTPILTKAKVTILNTNVEGQYAGFATPDIEASALRSAQQGYSNGLGSAAWKVEHLRIQLDVMSIDKIRPWEVFEFNRYASGIPDRYKNKLFRPSAVQYDLKKDRATITAYQIAVTQSEYDQFVDFVADDFGTLASPANAEAILNIMGTMGLAPLLVCTCDAGKALKLYTILQ